MKKKKKETKKKEKVELNCLGYPVNDPYGLIAAFYRAFGGKQNVR
ncbi:hypothetical protein [uncultured Mediterranean phage uvMED]|nr:hypothetical protein [uncultured Mediterranean phage uvMED]